MTYPITDEFARKVREQLAKAESGWDAPEVANLAHVIQEWLGEYEHGSVDIEDAFGVKSPFEGLDPENSEDKEYEAAIEAHDRYLQMASNLAFDILGTFAFTVGEEVN